MSERPAPATRDEQLAAALEADGDRMLREIFARMAEAFDAEAAGDTRAVLEWQIDSGPDEAPRRYQLVIAEGACAVDPAAAREPNVVFTIDGVGFLQMVSGEADPGELFMFGRLRATGDLFLAARSRTFFPPPEGQ
jgi:putative sterol carrier protein